MGIVSLDPERNVKDIIASNNEHFISATAHLHLSFTVPRKMFVFSPKAKDVKITFPTLANATNNVLQIIPVAFADIPS